MIQTTTRKMTAKEQMIFELGKDYVFSEMQKRADYLCMWIKEQKESDDVVQAYITGVQDMIPQVFTDIAYKAKESHSRELLDKLGGK